MIKFRHFMWKTFLFIIGAVPYIVLSFIVIWLWNKSFPQDMLNMINTTNNPNFITVLSWSLLLWTKPIEWLLVFSMMGSYTAWYLICKLIKIVIDPIFL